MTLTHIFRNLIFQISSNETHSLQYWHSRTNYQTYITRITKSKRQNSTWLKLTDTIFIFGTCPSPDRGHAVVQWLRHCATNRKVAGSIPDGVRIFHWHNPSRPDNVATFMCRLSWNLGASTSRNPQGLSRPVIGLLYLALPSPDILKKYGVSEASSVSLIRQTSVYPGAPLYTYLDILSHLVPQKQQLVKICTREQI
jgi:hypothetical protein